MRDTHSCPYQRNLLLMKLYILDSLFPMDPRETITMWAECCNARLNRWNRWGVVSVPTSYNWKRECFMDGNGCNGKVGMPKNLSEIYLIKGLLVSVGSREKSSFWDWIIIKGAYHCGFRTVGSFSDTHILHMELMLFVGALLGALFSSITHPI